MRTRLRLFLEWGITFEEPYIVPERADRAVAYANREDWSVTFHSQIRRRMRICVEPMPFPDAAALPMSLL